MRRKPNASSNQLDFFGNGPEPAPVRPAKKIKRAMTKPAPRPYQEHKSSAPPAVGEQRETVSKAQQPAPVSIIERHTKKPEIRPARRPQREITALDLHRDEWWTTKMVCKFLKISRTTLWERRHDRTLDFPKPAHLGSRINLYRAAAIRAWADTTETVLKD
jgi:predicted DNA-binding transcriptional regulator AlpA